MTTAPVLLIEGLEKRFGEVAVLHDVHAALMPGEVTAFIGPNGAGKTTLFHAITGDLWPDAGMVSLNGTEITRHPPWRIARRGLGKMFQDVRVFENLSIMENVLLCVQEHAEQTLWKAITRPWRRKGFDPEQVTQAEVWLEKAGVETPWDRPAGELSFGNRKLLALARLMAGKFDVLLLDEPTSGVSPAMIERMAALIRELSDRGVTIALIEHNFSFVREIAQTCYLLRDGIVHDSGATGEILNKQENREILIGL